MNTIFVGSSYYLTIIEWGWEWCILENFRRAFSPDPTDCSWVSEDGGDVVGSRRVGFLNILQFLWSESIFFFGKVMRQHLFLTCIQFISVFTASANILFQNFPTPLPPPPPPPSKNNDPSLSKDEFERRTSSGSGLLTFVGSDFAQIVALLY